MVAENTDQPQVAHPQPYPSHITLLGSIAVGWTVYQPLRLMIEQEDDGWVVVSDDVFAVYGDGATLNAARQSYIVSLIDYYEMLAEHAHEDRFNADQLERLRSCLRPQDR